ncbi:hypothetical protein [Streptomyces clavuligerus]|nr:hypothetical protein [Streptomyces clavuligerus]
MEEALALVEPGSREADALGVQHAVLRLHLAQLTGARTTSTRPSTIWPG